MRLVFHLRRAACFKIYRSCCEENIAIEKPQGMRIASAGLDPAHHKRRGSGANNFGYWAFVANWRASCVREVKCDLNFFFAESQQLRSLLAVPSIRPILSRQ
jgi:hypothetical protein